MGFNSSFMIIFVATGLLIIGDLIVLYRVTLPGLHSSLRELPEESAISETICIVNKLAPVKVYEKPDGSNYGELKLSQIDACILGDVMMVSFPRGMSREMKSFIIGHEIGHYSKNHIISGLLISRYETIVDFIRGLFKFSILNTVIWAVILFGLYKQYNGDVKNLLGIIPAYLSILFGVLVLKWFSRQREFSCDGYGLNAQKKMRESNLKGAEELFDLWISETNWFERTIGVIFCTHPSPYSRKKKLQMKFKSEANDLFNTGLRIVLTIIGVLLFWLFLDYMDINIFKSEAVHSIYSNYETEVFKSLGKLYEIRK